MRLAKPSHTIQSPPAEAFKLRKNEKELSFGWLEYFTDCHEEFEQVGGACTHMRRNLTIDREHFLQVDVDRARALLEAIDDLVRVRLVYAPLLNEPGQNDNPSHAEARGIDELQEPFQQLAAEQLALAVVKRYTWRDLRKHGIVLVA